MDGSQDDNGFDVDAWSRSDEAARVRRMRLIILLLLMLGVAAILLWLPVDLPASAALERARAESEIAERVREVSQQAISTAEVDVSRLIVELDELSSAGSPDSSSLTSRLESAEVVLSSLQEEGVRADVRAIESAVALRAAEAAITRDLTRTTAYLLAVATFAAGSVAIFRYYSAERRREFQNRMIFDRRDEDVSIVDGSKSDPNPRVASEWILTSIC